MLASVLKLMAETIERQPDRAEDGRDEIGDVVDGLDRGLNDREFVAAEPRDKSVGADAEAQARGDRFEQFVADHVTERIIDALEFVDVDVVHGKVFARRDACEFLLQPLAKQGAVRQIGQGVVVGKVRDPLLGAPAFGDVLVSCDPSAVRQRFVGDLHRAPVRGLDDADLRSPDVAQDGIDVLVFIADERARRLAMGDDVEEAAAGFHNVLGEPVHFDVTMIADHQPLRRIEQQQALRHVVDGAVQAQFLKRQPQLGQAMFLRQPAHDQKQHSADHEHRGDAGADQEIHLLAPIGERSRYGRRRHDHDRKIDQHVRGNQPVLTVDRADQAGGEPLLFERPLLVRSARPDISSDHAFDMRIAGEQRAVASMHRDRSARRERYRPEKLLEARRRDRARNNAEEFAMRSRHLPRKYRCPALRETTLDQLHREWFGCGSGFQFLEEASIRDADVGHRPMFRGVDQRAVGVEDIDAGDIGLGAQLQAQDLVPRRRRHLRPEDVRRGDPGSLQLGDNIFLDPREILELLIEVAGQQQNGVFQLAVAAFEGALTEIAGHHRRAEGDRGDQQQAAADQPADRAASNRRFDVDGGRALCHRDLDGFTGSKPRVLARPCIGTMPIWK